MDWYPLWNSIGIFRAQQCDRFFCGNFSPLIMWPADRLGQRHFGCDFYPSHGAASYSVRLFPVNDIWSASAL